jgi:hypothetical protein
MDLSLLSTFLPDGGMLDSTLGTLFVAAFDCRLAPAPGVQVSIEPKGSSTTLYQLQETYSATASATDPSGVAGFVNAPVFPTTLQITVTPLALGRPSGQMPVFVRASGEAEIFALPTQ